MKLGINLLCASGFIDTRHVETFELAKEAGFDGVEIPVLSGTPDHYERLARFLDQLQMERTTSIVIPEPSLDPGSADPTIRQRGLDHLNWAIACNEALGSTSIGGPFHAPVGHSPGRGLPRTNCSAVPRCITTWRNAPNAWVFSSAWNR